MTEATPYPPALLAEVIDRGWAEILADLHAHGWEVATFADLHDYVDANVYGGLCDGAATIIGRRIGRLSPEGWVALGNAAQDEWDLRIREGAHLAALGPCRVHEADDPACGETDLCPTPVTGPCDNEQETRP